MSGVVMRSGTVRTTPNPWGRSVRSTRSAARRACSGWSRRTGTSWTAAVHLRAREALDGVDVGSGLHDDVPGGRDRLPVAALGDAVEEPVGLGELGVGLEQLDEGCVVGEAHRPTSPSASLIARWMPMSKSSALSRGPSGSASCRASCWCPRRRCRRRSLARRGPADLGLELRAVLVRAGALDVVGDRPGGVGQVAGAVVVGLDLVLDLPRGHLDCLTELRAGPGGHLAEVAGELSEFVVSHR